VPGQRRDYIDPTYELLISTLPRARSRVGSVIYVDVCNALRVIFPLRDTRLGVSLEIKRSLIEMMIALL